MNLWVGGVVNMCFFMIVTKCFRFHKRPSVLGLIEILRVYWEVEWVQE